MSRLREQNNQRFGPSSSVERKPFKNPSVPRCFFLPLKGYFISTKFQLACECMSLSLFVFLSLTGYNIYVYKMYIPMCKRASLFRTLWHMRIKIRWTLGRKLKREVHFYILVKRQNEIENWNKFLTWTSLFMARRNKCTLYLHKYSFHKIRMMCILKNACFRLLYRTILNRCQPY